MHPRNSRPTRGHSHPHHRSEERGRVRRSHRRGLHWSRSLALVTPPSFNRSLVHFSSTHVCAFAIARSSKRASKLGCFPSHQLIDLSSRATASPASPAIDPAHHPACHDTGPSSLGESLRSDHISFVRVCSSLVTIACIRSVVSPGCSVHSPATVYPIAFAASIIAVRKSIPPTRKHCSTTCIYGLSERASSSRIVAISSAIRAASELSGTTDAAALPPSFD